ncbi:MAG: bifunctional phosphoribosylaminoimidazolecarboxamide formyltransferase/IMP cyclohydrolase, partial [Candidatus Hydrothermae bacterium]|nr:bifunctional phosphoribosylaminoimidazolecarboxamide formyltransferase/IMP cyclohydrolase [Candidatus Hydrothermae bacterium]
LVDLYAALRLTEEFLDQGPTCVIVKHTNPCGVAHGDTALEAFRRALEGDPVSAFGGIVSLNVPVSRELAEALNEMFLEIVAAPDFEEGAWEILTRKKNRRIVQVNYPLPHTLDYRVLGGDLLVQEEDRTVLDPSRLEVVADQPPDEATLRDLTFAYTVVKHVKSNAIVVAHNLQVLGVGAGQTNRVRAVELALDQAGEKARGAVLASDAFFPFPDSIERAAQAGIRAVIQPGGSVRDEQVIQRARELGLTLLHTGVRHFRH